MYKLNPKMRLFGNITLQMPMGSSGIYQHGYKNNFNGAIEVVATTYVAQYKVWVAVFNTSVLQSGKQYYMRYTVNDGENVSNTTYPNNQTSFVFKSIWSFAVQ